MEENTKLAEAKKVVDQLDYKDKALLTEYLKDCLSKERGKILPEMEAALNKQKAAFFNNLSKFNKDVVGKGNSFLDRLRGIDEEEADKTQEGK